LNPLYIDNPNNQFLNLSEKIIEIKGENIKSITYNNNES